MCAITGWNGRLPTGFLFQLLRASESRGKDSTGVAFWHPENERIRIIKQAVSATQFTATNRDAVAQVQRGVIGLSHTRRASPRMPINNTNAHPFMWLNCVFAHNGVIKNWQTLKQGMIDSGDVALKAYGEKVTTDSMVIGPSLVNRDFTQLIGAMAFVWMRGPRVWVFRSRKELTAAKLVWSYASESSKSYTTYLAASTWDIIITALNATQNLLYKVEEVLLNEGEVYEITRDGIVSEGAVEINPANAPDKFTSGQ